MSLKISIALVLSIAFVPSAFALRCGSDLIITGDSQSRVLKKCGEPESTFSRTVVRSAGIGVAADAGPGVQQVGFDHAAVEFEVEEWEYSFGPRRFGRRVIFENGRVVKIELLKYDN